MSPVEGRSGHKAPGPAKVLQKLHQFNTTHPKLPYSRADFLAKIQAELLAHRINQAGRPLNDYGTTRVPAQDKPATNKSAAVWIKEDCAHVTDFTTGLQITIFADGAARRLTGPEQARIEAIRKQAEKDQRQKQQAGTRSARLAWDRAEACIGTAYTHCKLIQTHGARYANAALLVPIVNVDGELMTLQRIYDNGDKKTWFGASTRGHFALIGELSDETPKAYVCEGFATAASLFQHTGVTTVAALNCSNLMAVCKALRARYPNMELCVCGDDDRQTRGNPGRTTARHVADTLGLSLAMPELCRCCTCTDWNDVAVCEARRGVSS